MRYWLDTEFIEDGKTIDLISIGVVAEDGREYYAINKDCNFAKASDWVEENVLRPIGLSRKTGANIDHQSPNARNSYLQMKRKDFIAIDVVDFMGGESIIPENPRMERVKHQLKEGAEKPEIWGEWSSYDWVAFCQLFGTMMDLPTGFPMRCRDIIQLAEDDLGIPSSELPPSLEIDGNHHALLGAKTVMQRYLWLKRESDAA